MSDKTSNDYYQSIESRRSAASLRRMTIGRRLYYFLGTPLLRFLLWLLNSSYRFQPMIGGNVMERIISDHTVCVLSYWHQHHVVCSTYMLGLGRRGFNTCFLISGSVDGEVPERIARSMGAEVIRGSANQSGALAMRDQQSMMKRGYSIVTTPDGPNGPKYEFKAGALIMARIGGAPILPVACAADRAWYLKRWDNFMIPKPFARVVMAVGEPYEVPRNVRPDEIEPHRLKVQEAMMTLMSECEDALQRG